MKVSQDITIIQQILSMVQGTDTGLTLNFNTFENIVVGDHALIEDSGSLPAPKNRCALPRSEINPKQIQHFEALAELGHQDTLYGLLSGLPRPRLDTLLYSIFKMCADRNMTQSQIADWLGLAKSTVCQWFKRFDIGKDKGNKS